MKEQTTAAAAAAAVVVDLPQGYMANKNKSKRMKPPSHTVCSSLQVVSSTLTDVQELQGSEEPFERPAEAEGWVLLMLNQTAQSSSFRTSKMMMKTNKQKN